MTCGTGASGRMSLQGALAGLPVENPEEARGMAAAQAGHVKQRRGRQREQFTGRRGEGIPPGDK